MRQLGRAWRAGLRGGLRTPPDVRAWWQVLMDHYDTAVGAERVNAFETAVMRIL